MVDILPDDLFDKRQISPSQPASEEVDYLGAIERIIDKADGLLSKVAMSRGFSFNGGSQATQEQKQGLTLGDIKTALETVRSAKGDIPISELLVMLQENKQVIEGVLKK
ncbi:hypothetical protein [uncultured Methanolobus sp.]|uniref:hypothetical protein n=1 Tax=uncultured Methanolobus sp. TaxID=218300 RepID=UPI0029C6AF8B|nr:hypothetical protein [uncultured Methanolobus sp.]